MGGYKWWLKDRVAQPSAAYCVNCTLKRHYNSVALRAQTLLSATLGTKPIGTHNTS